MPMPPSKRVEDSPRVPDDLRENVTDLVWLEELLRGAREQLEEDVVDWTAELTAAQATMRGARGKRPLAGAVDHLDRLAEALHQAPGRLETQLRARLGARHGQVKRGWDALFDHAPIGMVLINMDRRRVHVNDALCRLTGYSRHQLVRTTVAAITHPDDVDLDAEDRQRLLAGDISAYQIEKRYVHAWGHYIWVLVTVSLIRDDKGRPLFFISQVQDISERKVQERRLQDLVDHDFLTRLFNRRRLEQELTKEARRAARYSSTGAVLVIDLDHFKEVNDQFCHQAGDDLLKTVAGALRHAVRQTDTLARVGGDEFAVILPHASADQAQLVAESIVRGLRRQVAVLGDQVIHATASVGIATIDDSTAEEVLACADLAMYNAKEAGGDRFAMYVAGTNLQARAPARADELEWIRQAIHEERLLLYCQPIVDLANQEVSRYELLVRIEREPGAAPLLPSTFLGVAERFDLVQSIDAWVIRKAIALLAEHTRPGPPLALHVNLSAKSMSDPNSAAIAEAALAGATIAPARLIFELTETAAIANLEEVTILAGRLQRAGCQFALDNFGAGFGSFSYLKHVPFDFLKIDGDFVRNLAAGSIDQVVLKAIVGVAKGLGKKTVAESIENADVTRLLRDSGVDYGQGFYLGRPQAVGDVLVAA
jgi:diguanylate cyclase (GGDEF)-like protein/PAS domain S-box-containing protein